MVIHHRFSDQWRIESRFLADTSTASAYRTFALGVSADNQSVDQFFFDQVAKVQSYYWRNDLIGKVATGSIKHEILTGLEVGRQYASLDFAAFPLLQKMLARLIGDVPAV